MLGGSTRGRRAMTLIEILLVLAIIAAISAMAYPMVKGAFGGFRLQAAADQVRAAWGDARNAAMTTGQVQLFRYNLQTGEYLIQPWSGDEANAQAATEGSAASNNGFGSGSAAAGSGSGAANGAPAGGSGLGGSSGSNVTVMVANNTTLDAYGNVEPHVLSGGVLFHCGEATGDSRQDQVLSTDANSKSDTGNTAPPILFFADGTTSEARLCLVNDRDRAVILELRGLNGTAKISEVMDLSAVPNMDSGPSSSAASGAAGGSYGAGSAGGGAQ